MSTPKDYVTLCQFFLSDRSFELVHLPNSELRVVFETGAEVPLYTIDQSLVVRDSSGARRGSGSLTPEGWVFTNVDTGCEVKTGEMSTVRAGIKFVKRLIKEDSKPRRTKTPALKGVVP